MCVCFLFSCCVFIQICHFQSFSFPQLKSGALQCEKSIVKKLSDYCFSIYSIVASSNVGYSLGNQLFIKRTRHVITRDFTILQSMTSMKSLVQKYPESFPSHPFMTTADFCCGVGSRLLKQTESKQISNVWRYPCTTKGLLLFFSKSIYLPKNSQTCHQENATPILHNSKIKYKQSNTMYSNLLIRWYFMHCRWKAGKTKGCLCL